MRGSSAPSPCLSPSERRSVGTRSFLSLPDAARVHVEIGFLTLDSGLQPAVTNIVRNALHMPAGLAVERNHAGEKLHHLKQARLGVVATNLAPPSAADRQ